MRTSATQRIASLDIFRALTMFFMLFVNDIPGLRDIPHWLLHAKATEDMLGFSDIIFPAFLFAMGMAIPLAIENRIRKGDTPRQLVIHIVERTIALLVMGLFTVNLEALDATATGISYSSYTLLMVLAFFLIWSVYPNVSNWKKRLFLGMKIAGIALLVFLFWIYEGHNGSSFGPRWWGILGLIGWTYLVCAVIYLFTRKSLLYNSIALVIMFLLSIGSAAGWFQNIPLVHYIPSGATHHAFGMAGLWATLLMQRYANQRRPVVFYRLFVGIGIVMLLLAVCCHQCWIISKIQATPTWLFYCLTICFPLFAFIYWLTDIQGKSYWFDVIKPAGTATLTCYILPYALYSLMAVVGLRFPEWMGGGFWGILKSLLFSFFTIGITWILVKGKVKLKV